MDLVVGDRVRIVNRGKFSQIVVQDERLYGMVGTVVDMSDYEIDTNRYFGSDVTGDPHGRIMVIDFDETIPELFFDIEGRCPDNHGFFAFSDTLEKIGHDNKYKKKLAKTYKCCVCGREFSANKIVRSADGNYVCNNCLETKDYSTESTNTAHSPKGHHKTYGFEFECVPKTREDGAVLLGPKYAFIPTHDDSIPSDGVEYKTPIYQSLNGLKSVFKTCEKHADFSSRFCGQHINIGDANYINRTTMGYILAQKNHIFHPLERYMLQKPESVERLFGRNFVRYADSGCTFTDHSSWINLSNSNRIEFRLAKFKNAIQYFHLVCMCADFVDCIVKNYIKKIDEAHSNEILLANRTGKKLVKIFKKYENGQANCQSASRSKGEPETAVNPVVPRKPRKKITQTP